MIRILLIEDNPEDALRIKKALASAEDNAFFEPFDFTVVGSLGKGLGVLTQEKTDVVLLDMGLPDARNFDGIDRIKKKHPLIPIVVLTNQTEETLIGVEAVKHGAQDYFFKGHLSDVCSLDRVIRYAIERKKHEEEIIAAREKAERASSEAIRASKAKSEFLSNMSHDIRTPLNCIIGVADLLSRAKLSEDEANYVQMLNKASDNLLSLINDILDLSKIESGLIKISKTEFDLMETVESILDIVSTRAHAKNLEMIFRIAPDVPRRLTGDPEHLGQILLNFLGNAIKFTKSGEVLLAVSNVSSSDKETVIQFDIKDTGIGIPNDKLSIIFESFTQLDHKDASLKRQGSGLGLSICKKLIEMMNGTVNVQSEIDKGSTFQFRLPFDVPHVATSQQAVIPPLNLQGQHVLVVEDNEAQRFSLKELLAYWGATVDVAANSQEALRLAKAMRKNKRKFDIALLDLRMPGIATGGIELSQALKDDLKSVIMMLPTNHRYGDLENLKKAGIERSCFKPTKPEQLAEMISGILQQGSDKSQRDGTDIKPASSKPASPAPLKLLVVDDSEENRKLIQAYCKDTEIKIEMAEDGQRALEKFKTNAFDLVLMDIQMPTMNGYEALAAIREWETSRKQPRVPILALTAFALKEEAQRCIEAGFKAHITKPIRKNDLMQALKKYVA